MDVDPEYKWKHKTLSSYPYNEKHVGIVLLDEEPGFTGIYIRTESGGLWPARTVSRESPKHHDDVCAAWMAREGRNEDLRAKG